jgi:chromosome segregation ATPase
MNKSVKQVIVDFEFVLPAAKDRANKCLNYNTAQAQVYELCNQLDYAVNNSNNLVSELESKSNSLNHVLITANKLNDELTKAKDNISNYKSRIDDLTNTNYELIQDKDNLIVQNTQLIT